MILVYFSVKYQTLRKEEEEEEKEEDNKNMKLGFTLIVFFLFLLILVVYWVRDKKFIRNLFKNFKKLDVENISSTAIFLLFLGWVVVVQSSSTESYNIYSLILLIMLTFCWIIYSIKEKKMPIFFIDKILTLCAYLGLLLIKLYNFSTGIDECAGSLFGKLQIGRCEEDKKVSQQIKDPLQGT